MAYSVTIDWLSFTVHTEREATDVLTYLNPSGIMEPEKPKFGYERSARGEAGFSVLSSRGGSGMGCHFIIPGSALRGLSERGVGGLSILEKAITNGAKITRLDLAKDAKDENFELIQFSSLLEQGKWMGTAQKSSTVKSSDGGLTCYIGSRQSERFIRVYDKGVESGKGGDWIRLELETKGESAQAIANALANGSADPNAVLATLVGKMCQVSMQGWAELLNSEADWAMPKIEKQSDREKWISEQVGQAIIDHLDHNPDSPAVRRLYELLKSRLQ